MNWWTCTTRNHSIRFTAEHEFLIRGVKIYPRLDSHEVATFGKEERERKEALVSGDVCSVRREEKPCRQTDGLKLRYIPRFLLLMTFIDALSIERFKLPLRQPFFSPSCKWGRSTPFSLSLPIRQLFYAMQLPAKQMGWYTASAMPLLLQGLALLVFSPSTCLDH